MLAAVFLGVLAAVFRRMFTAMFLGVLGAVLLRVFAAMFLGMFGAMLLGNCHTMFLGNLLLHVIALFALNLVTVFLGMLKTLVFEKFGTSCIFNAFISFQCMSHTFEQCSTGCL